MLPAKPITALWRSSHYRTRERSRRSGQPRAACTALSAVTDDNAGAQRPAERKLVMSDRCVRLHGLYSAKDAAAFSIQGENVCMVFITVHAEKLHTHNTIFSCNIQMSFINRSLTRVFLNIRTISTSAATSYVLLLLWTVTLTLMSFLCGSVTRGK